MLEAELVLALKPKLIMACRTFYLFCFVIGVVCGVAFIVTSEWVAFMLSTLLVLASMLIAYLVE